MTLAAVFAPQPDDTWRFAQVPQLLLPGDRSDVIA